MSTLNRNRIEIEGLWSSNLGEFWGIASPQPSNNGPHVYGIERISILIDQGLGSWTPSVLESGWSYNIWPSWLGLPRHHGVQTWYWLPTRVLVFGYYNQGLCAVDVHNHVVFVYRKRTGARMWMRTRATQLSHLELHFHRHLVLLHFLPWTAVKQRNQSPTP